MKRLLIGALLLVTNAPQPLLGQETPQAIDLPEVLIIGDSISNGYTPHVAQLLKEKAIVKHHRGNAQHTGTGLKKLDQWIGKTEWDVIHFNWGLWDLCYRHPESKVQGKRDKVNGTITTTLEQYEKNLDKLVTRLKKTDAKLIWAHTTVVPEKEAGRIVGDDKKYNDVAARIMQEYGVTINDLHSLSKAFPFEHFKKPGDVHYTMDGYKKLAEQVADKLLTTLGGEQENLSDKK
jgi:lysophospholipase L1-like esterase